MKHTISILLAALLAFSPACAADPVASSSAAYEASHIFKTTGGTLIALVGYNSKASAQFIQIFDSATLPAEGAVPLVSFTVAATSNFSVTIPLTGLPCANGITVSNSSTGPTKTIGSADVFFTVVIK